MYLIEPKIAEAQDIKFSVIKPPRLKQIGVFLFAVVLNAMWIIVPGLIGLSIIVLPIISYFAVKMWNKYTKIILQDYLVNNFRKYHLKKQGSETGKEHYLYRLIENMMGLSLSQENRYFIEAEIIDVDLRSIRATMKSRIVDLISACLGIVGLIGVILRNSIYIKSFNLNLAQFGVLMIFTLIISPILVSWLIPVIWVLRDARIKVINTENHTDNYFEFVRKGFLSRFLGISGFIGLYSVLLEVSEILAKTNADFENNIFAINTVALLAFIGSILTIAGTAYFVGMLYLFTKHEDAVNDLRTILSHYIPVGLTSIRGALPEELEFFQNRETKIIVDKWGGDTKSPSIKNYKESEVYKRIPKIEPKMEDTYKGDSDDEFVSENQMNSTMNSEWDSSNSTDEETSENAWSKKDD